MNEYLYEKYISYSGHGIDGSIPKRKVSGWCTSKKCDSFYLNISYKNKWNPFGFYTENVKVLITPGKALEQFIIGMDVINLMFEVGWRLDMIKL